MNLFVKPGDGRGAGAGGNRGTWHANVRPLRHDDDPVQSDVLVMAGRASAFGPGQLRDRPTGSLTPPIHDDDDAPVVRELPVQVFVEDWLILRNDDQRSLRSLRLADGETEPPIPLVRRVDAGL